MIPWFKPQYWGNEKQYVLDALDSTWISDGAYVKNFEREFAHAVGAREAITVSNGTTALYLALLTSGIGPGDEVIIPGYTFAAPANMTLACGATPVFVDVDPYTWLLDPTKLKSAITERTRAILPVHIYGNVCDMSAINTIAKQHNFVVIEDVAEAAFSKQNKIDAGLLGDIGCFSFQATKTLTTGEGGAVVIQDQELCDKARVIRNHGMTSDKPYWHFEVGHNFRLTNMQAAFGLAQLEERDAIIREKRRVYETYCDQLTDIAGVNLQSITKDTQPLMWAIAIQVESVPVEQVRNALKQHGIETRPGFYAFTQMPLYQSNPLPASEYISSTVLSLPSYPGLSDDEINGICQTLKSITERLLCTT